MQHRTHQLLLLWLMGAFKERSPMLSRLPFSPSHSFPALPPLAGAFIEGDPVLSWAANNTAKMGLTHQPDGISCW